VFGSRYLAAAFVPTSFLPRATLPAPSSCMSCFRSCVDRSLNASATLSFSLTSAAIDIDARLAWRAITFLPETGDFGSALRFSEKQVRCGGVHANLCKDLAVGGQLPSSSPDPQEKDSSRTT